MVLFDLAVSSGDPAAAVHDSKDEGHLEHHGAHRAVPGDVPLLLHVALVHFTLGRYSSSQLGSTVGTI